MQISKEKLRKRLQAKLDKLAAEKAAVDAQWPQYVKDMLAHEEAYCVALQASSNEDDYNLLIRAIPSKPNIPRVGWTHADAVKRLTRNLAILDALEGDSIEIEKLRTGRNFTLESIFEEDL